MRAPIAVFCAMLMLHSMPIAAEAPAIGVNARPIGREDVGASGLEDPWPPRSFGPRLAQMEGEETAVDATPELDARIAELEARRAGISRRWPVAGMVVGGLMVTGGVITLLLINTTCRDDSFGSGPPTTRCAGGSIDGKWAAGGATVGTGLILIGVSGWKLAMHARESRAIRREILELKRGRAARSESSWDFGFEAGERKSLRLGWRF